MRAKEFQPGNKDLVIFDIDDTLMHTTAKIKVVKNGQVVKSLTNQEFNNYELQPDEEFDFGEFRSAEKFRQESKPIVPMVRKLKAILSHAGNAKVIMLTARADFDDKEKFLQTFQDLGIDMSRVHVHRAGNLPGNEPPAYKKAIWVRRYLDTKQYGHVRLYDDSMSNLRVFKELKKDYPQVDFRAIYVGPGGATQTVESQTEDEIHNYDKLDSILRNLCKLVVRGQEKDSEKFGMVAAAVLDSDNNLVTGINLPGADGKRKHAERVAIENYYKKFGEIPEGSIIITTCSPCSEDMSERYGEDCTSLINQVGVKKVYAGYIDPTQPQHHRKFNIMETADVSIRDICKEFADTFLTDQLMNEKWSTKYKRSINCSNPKGFSQKAHCAGRKKTEEIDLEERKRKGKKFKGAAYGPGPYGWYGYDAGYSGDSGGDGGAEESINGEDYDPNGVPPGPEFKPTMPQGTVKVDVSDVYDWYKLGQHISNLKGLGKHDFGKGPPSTIMAFGSEEEEHKYIKNLKKTGLTTTDIDPPSKVKGPKQKLDPTYNVGENFADGRNPQDKGDAKRHGINTKASVSSLRKTAKQGGRKGQLAHWLANMKAGRAKKK